jgi:hypothetical protein
MFSICTLFWTVFIGVLDIQVEKTGGEFAMSLSDLELRGVKLPEKETYLGDLSANQIVEKVNLYQERLNRESRLQIAPIAETYFLNLIALYPVSMCSRNMTDALKLLAALYYFGSKPIRKEDQKTSEEDLEAKDLFPRNKPSSAQVGYSLEDLALIFDRTRAAISEAIKQKREEAQVMLEEAALRCGAKKIALEELTEDEKRVLSAQDSEKIRKSLPS